MTYFFLQARWLGCVSIVGHDMAHYNDIKWQKNLIQTENTRKQNQPE